MLTQHKELFAPSEHYQEAISAETRRLYQPPVEGPKMPEEIKEHLEAMLAQAEKETELQSCRLVLQYCTGFIGHAALSKQCTFEERKHYWERIDKIRDAAMDRQKNAGGRAK